MSKQNSPHRHHYIPQMILRNFVHDEGGLYFWRRGSSIGNVRSTTPGNLFLEDNLYTIVDDDGQRNVTLEQGFARMESTGARLIAELLSHVRAGRVPRLNQDAWEFFHLFHYYSAKRSAAWHRRFLPQEEVMAVAKEIAKERRWTDADRGKLSDHEDLARVMNNARIAAQGTPPPDDLLAAMRSRGMAIYVAPPRASFILGDHPTAMARVGLAASGAIGGRTYFMPVAHDVAIGYFDRPRAVHLDHLTRPQVRSMNEAMTRQSLMIAGRSQALLRSLSRLGYETPEYFTTADYLYE